MTSAELQKAIVDAWTAQKPATDAQALDIANAVLADHPKERNEFAKWFERNGADVLRRLNNG